MIENTLMQDGSECGLARPELWDTEERTFNGTLDELRELHRRAGPGLAKETLRFDKKIKPELLYTAPHLFQPRTANGAMVEDHIRKLTKSMLNSNEKGTAIIVFAVDGKRLVIDGHCRLKAALEAKRLAKGQAAEGRFKTVPIRHFEGSVDEAVREAAAKNSRDKLRLTPKEKIENAWALVKQGVEGSAAEIARQCDVSERSIRNMRKRWRELLKFDEERREKTGRGLPDFAGISWGRAKTIKAFEELLNGRNEFDVEDWKRQKADRLVKELVKTRLPQIGREQLEVAVMAIEQLFEGSLTLVESAEGPEETDF